MKIATKNIIVVLFFILLGTVLFTTATQVRADDALWNLQKDEFEELFFGLWCYRLYWRLMR